MDDLALVARLNPRLGTPVDDAVRMTSSTRRISVLVLAAVLGVAGSVLLVVPAGAAGSTTQLTIANFSFSPTPLTITAGATVRVTNNDVTTHTWTSDDGDPRSWNSGSLDPGQSFSVTFTTPGTYGYHCAIHTFMTGTIVVRTAPATTTTASPTTTATGPANTATSTARAQAASGSTGVTGATLPHTGSGHAVALFIAAMVLLAAGGGVALATRRRRVVSDS